MSAPILATIKVGRGGLHTKVEFGLKFNADIDGVRTPCNTYFVNEGDTTGGKQPYYFPTLGAAVDAALKQLIGLP